MSEIQNTGEPGELLKLSINSRAGNPISLQIALSNERDAEVNSSGGREQGELAANKPIPQGFERKPCEPKEILPEFSKLSRSWTTLSLAFFDHIPVLTRANFEVAQGGMLTHMQAFAQKSAVRQEDTVLDDGGLLSEYYIPSEYTGILLKWMGKSTHALHAASMLSSATLGALISEYELFLANLLTAIARLRPKNFIRNDHKISVTDLENYNSFGEFIKDATDDYIASLMQEHSHFKMLKWIEKEFEVNLTSSKEIVAEFVEICQRRHLIAHAGGKVNKKYLEICIEAGVLADRLPKLGERVIISEQYIRRATARVYQVGMFTLHLLWQKLLPEFVTHSHRELLSSSHDFLESNLTKMASRVIDFAWVTEKKMEDYTKAGFAINSALSFSLDSSLEEEERKKGVDKALRRKDWSMISADVRLALACVKKDYGQLDELTQAAKREGLGHTEAMTWVVFREVREMPEFKKHFEY